MTRRGHTVAALALSLIWVLAAIPSADSATSSVRVIARPRPKICVTLAENGTKQALNVRANVDWAVITSDVDGTDGTSTRGYAGGRTTNAGRVISPPEPIDDFTALANP